MGKQTVCGLCCYLEVIQFAIMGSQFQLQKKIFIYRSPGNSQPDVTLVGI